MSAVAAVVPGFEPNRAAIMALVVSLRDAGLPTLVVDDGSPDAAYLIDLEILGADTARHGENRGIARSLNDGLEYAIATGAEWLLTVDQDTGLPPRYLETLLSAAAPGVGVIGAEVIGDAGGDLRYPTRRVGGRLTTEEVFQTGSLWSVSALRAIGGFDEDFGIDAVDASACLRLREHGFRVVLAPGARLDHHYGSGRHVRILGRSVVATGHSPERRETMVRNRLRLFRREFRQSPTTRPADDATRGCERAPRRHGRGPSMGEGQGSRPRAAPRKNG